MKFKLEILEYCNPKDLVEREQHYRDILKPEYNMLNTAYSSLGYKHTKDARKKMLEFYKDKKIILCLVKNILKKLLL